MTTFEVDETILIHAFRRALPLPMKQAQHVQYTLRFYWNKLSETARDQIKREIRVFTERGELLGANEIILWDAITNL